MTNAQSEIPSDQQNAALAPAPCSAGRRAMNVHPFHEFFCRMPAAYWATKISRPTHKQMLCSENMLIQKAGVLRPGFRVTVLRETFPLISPNIKMSHTRERE